MGSLRPAVSESGGWLPTDRRSLAQLSPRPIAQLLLLCGLLALFGFTMGFGPATAQTQTIDSCGVEINQSGTYQITGDLSTGSSACVTIDSSDVVLDGQGNTLSGDTGNAIVETNATGLSNVTVRDLQVDGGDPSVHLDGASDVRVSNVTIVNGGKTLYVSNSDGVLVENSTVDSSSNEMWFDGSSDVTVRDSLIRDSGSDYVQLGAGDSAAINLTVVRSGGIDVQTPNGTVRNSTIESPSSNHGIQARADDVLVANNTVTGVSQYALHVDNAVGVVVRDNEIRDSEIGTYLNAASELAFQRNTITTSGKNSQHTVNVGQSSNVRFDSNNVSGNHHTAFYNGDSNVTFVDNRVANNDGTGLHLSHSTQNDLVVRDNTIRDNAGDGIDQDGSDQRSIVEGNLIVGNDGRGYHLGSGTGARIQNNVVRSNTGRGIVVKGSDAVVSGNRLEANTQGLRVDSVDNVTMRENVAIDNSGAGFYVANAETEISFENVTARGNAWALTADAASVTADRFDVGVSSASNTTLDFTAQNVQLTRVSDLAAAPDGYSEIGRYVNASSTGSGSQLDFDLHYDDADASGVNESTLGIHHDGGDGNWTRVNRTSVDTDANLVSANVTSFSDFGAFGESVEASDFQVEIDDTTSPVLENDTLLVNATITNAGTVEDTQNVTLNASDGIQDGQDVSLNASENESITLAWDTDVGDAGNYTITVASENDSASTTVDVEAPAYFDVESVAADDPVTVGEDLDVTATVTNTGDRNATQDLNLTVDGVGEEATTQETISAGETTDVTLSWNTSGADAGTYDAIVASENASNATSVTVQEPANFTVAIDDTNSPVVRNETLALNATVANEGDVSETQTIELAGDGSVQDSKDVTLDGGSNQSITLHWSTDGLDAGEYEATVSSDNDTVTANVTVQTPANFSVAIVGVDDHVLEGEPLAVTANVTNTGEANGTQSIGLEVGEFGEVDAESVTLTGNESREVELTWSDTDGKAGEHGATVASEDDAASETVTVDEPAFFDVAIVEANDSVVAGADVVVTANVTNTGDRNDSQTVDLSMSDVGQVDATDVTVNASESTNVTLTWNTSGADATTYDATVTSENATDTTSVTVQAPASFDVGIVDADDTVVTGENATVTATVTNTGDVAGEQTLNLTIDGVLEDDAQASLAAAESTNVTLTWNTSGADAADYAAAVSSENDSDATTLTVLAPDAFEVTITGTNAPVTEGETLSVEADVSYEGAASANQTVSLRVDGNRDATTVSFEAAGTKSITLEWETASGDAGEYEANVSSEDDSAVQSVAVDEADDGGGIVLPPQDGGSDDQDGFEVSIDGTNAPVHVGEPLAVEVTATNPGESDVTDSITLSVAGDDRASRALTLSPGATRTVTLSWEPTPDDVGDRPATVASATDSAIRYVTIEEAPTLDVAIDGTNSPIRAGHRLDVTVRLTANGAVEDTVELLDANDARVDAQAVSLEANESRTVQLSWATGASDTGTGVVTVRGADDADSTSVRLDAPADLTVDILAASDTVTVGETIVFEARIANRGGETATGRARLTVAGEERTDEEVRLAGGEAETVRLEWTPGQSDVGTHHVRVAAGSGSDSSTVTVENSSSGGFVFDQQWSETAVDYEPTPQDTHVGGFAWLTLLVGGLGAFVLVTRRSRDARLLGVTLFAASARTGTDVLHAAVAGIQTEQLLALNASLELAAGLLFLAFAASYADHDWLLSRRGALALAGVGTFGVAAAVTNPMHGLVFGEVLLADGPFSYVTAETGPLGWVLLATTFGSLLAAVGLLARSFLTGTDPAWRPVGVLASGLCLAVVVVLLSVLERGPLPEYDYTGAGVAGMLAMTTTTLFGHGLHRIKQTAQQSLIEDLDDPIVIVNDARVVVECNAAARELLSGIDDGTPVEALFDVDLTWPRTDETTTLECSSSELLSPSPTSTAGREQPSADGGVLRQGDESAEQPSDDAGTEEPSAYAGTEGLDADATGQQADGARADRQPDEEPDRQPDGELDRSGPDGDSVSDAPDDEAATGAADGDAERHFLVHTTPVTADTGDSIGYTVRFTDVTALKRRRSALASRNAQLEQVASTISHDLRNPMTVASGHVEQLAVTTPEPESGEPISEPATLADSVEAIRESIGRMHDIIDDVLALARSKEPVTLEPAVSFASVVADAWATVDTDDASLSIDATGSIDADPQRLQRILENLFRNAVEHGRSDVTVDVGLTEDAFYVADDGPGIPADVGDAVFEQGYSSAQSGTGLGLSIVSQLARAHDWRVRLDQAAEGARFVFEHCETDVRHDREDDPFETDDLQ